MKFLVVIVVVLVVGWLLLKGGRRGGPGRRPPAERAAPAQQPMVRCGHCGVHLPRGDAVAAAGNGYFCSDEHRRLGARAP